MSRIGKFFFVLFGGTYGAKGDTSGDTCSTSWFFATIVSDARERWGDTWEERRSRLGRETG